MATPNELERELSRHAHGLRCMARDLVRDPHVADDAVQDTLHRALDRAAAAELEPGPLGGWLRRTLVNFTRQWRRREQRRRRRESAAPQREPEATPHETSSRRETLRCVTDAVLGLDEPYQTAIFLRYFEGLPPRAIARRTGEKLATVKSRLQRGLAMLRARLDCRAAGDRQRWRLALLGTFGLPAGAAAAGTALTTGTLLMGTTTKTLLAAGVIGALGLCFYGFGDDPVPDGAAATGAVELPAAATATGRDSTPDEVLVAREAAPPRTALPSWLDHPFTFEIDVLVVDHRGLPMRGEELRLAPAGCPLNEAAGSTDANGRLRVSWPSRLEAGEIVIADHGDALRRVPVRHGTPTSLTLVRDDGGRLTRLLGRSKRRVSFTVHSVAGGSFVVTNSSSMLSMEPGLHPHARFATSTSTKRSQPTAGLWLDYGKATDGGIALSLSALSGATEKVEDPAEARIAGTVFGEDGRPAAKVHVALLDADGHAVFHALTDEHGQFAFEELRAGPFGVRAGGGERGLATVPAITTAGTTPVTLNLARGVTVSGRAESGSGRPLEKLRVTWHAADRSWADFTETAADGSFTLANLPGVPGTVMLWRKDRPFPVAIAQDVLANTGDLLLRDTGATGSIRIDPVLHEGVGGQPEVRVFSEDTGVGATIPIAEDDEPRRLRHVPAGWYRVEARHPATGTIDAGRHWVDGENECDLGQVLLPRPAIVRLDASAASARDRELYRVRPDLDVRVEVREPAEGEPWLVEAGDYALFWKDAAGRVRFERFRAIAGEEVVVRIPR